MLCADNAITTQTPHASSMLFVAQPAIHDRGGVSFGRKSDLIVGNDVVDS